LGYCFVIWNVYMYLEV